LNSTFVLAGLTTDLCCSSTARTAGNLGFEFCEVISTSEALARMGGGAEDESGVPSGLRGA
jgi:hypothetical protein